MKQLPRACSSVLPCHGCGPDTKSGEVHPVPAVLQGTTFIWSQDYFPLSNSPVQTNKAVFFLICMLVMNEKLKNSSTKEFFVCVWININVLGIVFNPQIYKEVETAFNSLFCQIFLHLCLWLKWIQQRFACVTTLNLVYYSTFETR